MQNPQKLNFQAQELEIVAKVLKENTEKNNLLKQIQEALTECFHKERSESQILTMLDEINNEENKQPKNILITQKAKQNIQQPSLSLFKSFGNVEDINKQDNLQKKVVKRISTHSYRSLRKITPKQQASAKINCTLQDRLRTVQEINQQCTLTIDKFDRKLTKKISIAEPNSINEKNRWFFNEYFYSNYDKKFFMDSPLAEIISKLDIDPDIVYRQHKIILRSLPEPLLFSNKFIKMQKLKLEAHRNSCRQKAKMLSKYNQASDFAVHSIVLALHPLCGHLHLGSILAFYKENQYMVKFVKPELPTHKISDINMSTQFTNSNNKNQNRGDVERERVQGNRENSCSQIVDQINFESTGLLIKLLGFKNSVISQISKINDKIELIYSNQNGELETNIIQTSRKQQQWLFSILQYLEVVIKQTIIRFRLRGVNQLNSQTIFKNLNKLLLNPLKIMSKQFENSSESLDMRATTQIKQIIQKQRQNEVLAALSKIPVSLLEQMPTNSFNALKCCLSLLLDLKYQGKDFDLQKNSHVVNLIQLSIKENLNEQFNNIYEKLESVITKIRE